ncbi:hypothetical protein U1Q18_023095 [Sarracenia purpurea var. burkii]
MLVMARWKLLGGAPEALVRAQGWRRGKGLDGDWRRLTQIMAITVARGRPGEVNGGTMVIGGEAPWSVKQGFENPLLCSMLLPSLESSTRSYRESYQETLRKPFSTLFSCGFGVAAGRTFQSMRKSWEEGFPTVAEKI